jgi:hypothetical protein
MSPWIQHVKTFAKAKGMKYNEALKSSECKNSYKKQKTIVIILYITIV